MHLLGRIMAVADTYSAMTTDRPYRKALTRAEAISELHTCSGTQFDPQIVETFIACIETGRRGRDRAAERLSAAAFVLPVETETEADAETEAEETRERGLASGAFPRSKFLGAGERHRPGGRACSHHPHVRPPQGQGVRRDGPRRDGPPLA